MKSKNNCIESKENEKKTFSNRNNSTKKNIRTVKEFMRNRVSFRPKGFKEDINVDVISKCTRDFIETQNGKFMHNNNKDEVASFEVTRLRNQNNLLNQIITELSQENNSLKSRLLCIGDLKVS